METTTIRRNADRFIASTGKTEKEYQVWATQVGQRMHINKLDGIVCAKMDIYTVAHLIYRPTPFPEGMPMHEVDNFLMDSSQNPYELAQLWTAALINARNWVCKESILAEHLRAFPKSDFELHGDRNHLPDVSKSWFKKDGLNLDVQLMEINDMHLHPEWITLQDAIDFVKKYRPTGFKNPAEYQVERIENRFKEITSFQIKDYYVQHLRNMCETQPVHGDELPF